MQEYISISLKIPRPLSKEIDAHIRESKSNRKYTRKDLVIIEALDFFFKDKRKETISTPVRIEKVSNFVAKKPEPIKKGGFLNTANLFG